MPSNTGERKLKVYLFIPALFFDFFWNANSPLPELKLFCSVTVAKGLNTITFKKYSYTDHFF